MHVREAAGIGQKRRLRAGHPVLPVSYTHLDVYKRQVYGISSTEFAPNADISRQDMAVMLDRYAQQSGIVSARTMRP